jgi:hypothetical protein
MHLSPLDPPLAYMYHSLDVLCYLYILKLVWWGRKNSRQHTRVWIWYHLCGKCTGDLFSYKQCLKYEKCFYSFMLVL